MTKIALLCGLLAAAGLVTVTAKPLAAVDAASTGTGTRITISGTAHSLNAGNVYDAHTAYATVTTADGRVYDVMGGAGMITAQRADGKQVTVTGVPGEAGGQMTIQGRSIDVAIDGVPIEHSPPPTTSNPPTTANPPTTTTNPSPNAPPSSTTTTRVTLSGIAHALTTNPAGAKPNPSMANATLTVTAPNTNPPATITYLVYGYAGVILALQADGKQVEVTGVVSNRDGKPSIIGRSIDVSINGVPIEGGR